MGQAENPEWYKSGDPLPSYQDPLPLTKHRTDGFQLENKCFM